MCTKSNIYFPYGSVMCTFGILYIKVIKWIIFKIVWYPRFLGTYLNCSFRHLFGFAAQVNKFYRINNTGSTVLRLPQPFYARFSF